MKRFLACRLGNRFGRRLTLPNPLRVDRKFLEDLLNRPLVANERLAEVRRPHLLANAMRRHVKTGSSDKNTAAETGPGEIYIPGHEATWP